MRDNVFVMKRFVHIFFLAAFLGVWMPGARAYVSDEWRQETLTDYRGFRQIDAELGSQKTLVPGLESQWIICRNDPINMIDPDGEQETDTNSYQNRAITIINTAEYELKEALKSATLGLIDLTDVGDAKIALTGSDFSGNEYSTEMQAAAAGMILLGGSTKLANNVDLPNSKVASQNGVTIKHNYKSGDHLPVHLHVKGPGKAKTRIGPDGKPIFKKDPDLTPKQKKVVNSNMGKIKKVVAQIQTWIKEQTN